ncbi:MAG TPA: response regulator [Burkholderiales bacterium]|nr:response regulator [Burkholderiales bacterium]
MLGNKPNVLAVDDQVANLLSLEVVLQREFNLVRALSGAEAISILKTRQDIDVILMDVHMPVMDGFETAGQIKKMAGCEEIPIIFITAIYTEDPYIKRGYEAGGIDYFGKPYDPDILRMKLAVYASFRQRTQTLRERERHVRESEELLRVGRRLSSVLENLPVGVLIADLEGRICQSTEEVSRILRVTEPTESNAYGIILGWWDAEGKMLKDPEGSLTRALRDGKSSHSEPVQIRCLDGSMRTILSSVSPLRGVDGKTVGAVILIQDLTETKKIGEDLEERVNRLIGAGVELEQSVRR